MRQRLISGAYAAAILAIVGGAALLIEASLAPEPARASQNQLSSPTTGTVSGLQLTNNYNNALDSLNTGNSGASAPINQLSGSPSLGNVWINTTGIPYPWQVHDGSNWLTPFWIDATNHVANVKIGGGVATVASAATVDLCASSGNVAPRAYITITGTSTINSFGSTCNAGHVKFVTFTGALTLTYNATSLIIPGGQSVTTAPGDQAVLMALGSGNWQVAFYQPASGAALLNPAIDVGSYLFTSAVSPPSSKYLFAYGQPISRSTYATLMAVQTITQAVTRTNGSPTLTGFSDTTQIGAGACIEGAGIANTGACTASIISCTATTCTMNVNANSSGTANVTIFPNGNGDGVTTFNLPNCQGVTLAGRDNMSGTARGLLTSAYFNGQYGGADVLGALGGSQSQTLSQAMLPNVNFNVTIPAGQGSHSHTLTAALQTSALPFSGGSSAGGNVSITTNAAALPQMTGTAASGGSSTAFAIVQPTLTANCMIRVLSALETMPTTQRPATTVAVIEAATVRRRARAV
jgi:microcystin-dependent protein